MDTPTIGAVVDTRNGGPAADATLGESLMCSHDTAGNLFFARFATTSSTALTRSRESCPRWSALGIEVMPG